ncbi:type IV pilus modification protein PilV [Sansalvadorimonas sp. 2012CJ34-2]|uniref:Type IV pilus modification protein PilV n=1 Tax=Parendozoicomonas callyspongiae TaxID=2942213 RepID=A0ABT0PDP3_9GAMM|nr:type IV pilus modification protein PilV [Sansalvadorimonas sp. 2012CJ34-2]MCL6269484.1 type IV pilus modification protein PilV [Sansalvadorimonas sp. 2012CJ34-2]
MSRVSGASRKHLKGFNLIENLITLFVLSVGLLGVAGMQAMALKTHQTSREYGQALALAQGLADRVRANTEAGYAGQYQFNISGGSAGVENSDCLITAGCTPQELADHDLWEWSQSVARTLPYAEGYVCLDSSPSQDPADYYGDPDSVIPGSCDGTGDTYVIHIVWDMDPDRDGNITLTSNPSESDGHLVMAFEP